MLKKTASGVLASLRGSTYRSVRLATSLTAALLDGLFEHPEIIEAIVPSVILQRWLMYEQVFSQTIREIGRANGSVFLWAVIDTDPRNTDDLSAFQSPEFWHGQG
jgi:hypothetical protein